MLADIFDQGPRQLGGTALAHLGQMPPGQKGRNRMAKSFKPKVDLTQSIEEQKAGTNDIVLEFSYHELQRRQRRHLEQPAPQRRTPQQFFSLSRR
jgi:hypothetical protein